MIVSGNPGVDDSYVETEAAPGNPGVDDNTSEGSDTDNILTEYDHFQQVEEKGCQRAQENEDGD